MTDTMNALIAELSELRLPELRERYRAVLGTETRCPNRTFLIRSICSALRPAAPVDDNEQPAPLPAPPSETEPVALDEEDVESLEEDEADADSANAEPLEAAVVADAGTTTGTADEPPTLAVQTSEQPTRGRAPKVARPRIERQPRGRFSSMTVEELQAKYREVVGRDTGSDDKRYLIWKIREAEKGRVPVGPRAPRTRASETGEVRILPLRLEADAVAAMDAAWRARGMKTRMEFLRRALGHYLESLGATDAAAKFAGDASA